MSLKAIGTNLGVAVLSTILVLLAVEALFFLVNRSARSYPGVFFQTEDPRTMLLCYDDHFSGTPDWDLREDRPYARLKNIGNTTDDSRYYGVVPDLVPNATEIKTNSLNHRERPLTELERAGEGATLTLVVGDSFCFGQGVRAEDRFSNLLEARLGGEHVLVNACIPGMNIGRIPLVTKQLVAHFPDVRRVIYSFTLNDPIKDKRLRESQKRLNDFGAEWIPGDEFMHMDESPVLATARSMQTWWDSPTIRFFVERMKRNQVAEDTIEWYRQVYSENAGWEQTKALLVEMHEFCEHRQIEMVLVVFPLFCSLEDYPLLEAHGAIEEFAQDQGIAHFDLLDIFAGMSEEDYWVHPQDFHPNSRAHREAADYLYSALPW